MVRFDCFSLFGGLALSVCVSTMSEKEKAHYEIAKLYKFRLSDMLEDRFKGKPIEAMIALMDEPSSTQGAVPPRIGFEYHWVGVITDNQYPSSSISLCHLIVTVDDGKKITAVRTADSGICGDIKKKISNYIG